MKTFLTLLVSLCITFTAIAQSQKHPSYAAWQHPIIKQIQENAPGLIVYSDTNRFVNIAVLDTKSKLVYWIDAVGYVTDIIQLTDIAYNRITTKKENPFQYYERLMKDDIELYDAAIFKYRFPKQKVCYKGIPEYDSFVTRMMDIPEFKNAKTALEKLKALYRERQKYIDKCVFSNATHPYKLKNDTVFICHLLNVSRGKVTVTDHTDSTGFADFYSKDYRDQIYKATLDISKAKIYYYHQNQTVFDSLAINRKKIETIFNEGTDVFILYQNYTLWKLNALDSITKLVDNYKTKKYTSQKEKKKAEVILAGYNGNIENTTIRIRTAYRNILTRLDVLFGTSLRFLEQQLSHELSRQNPIPQYGEYINDKLVIQPLMINASVHTVTRGEQHYELTDHRGNVIAVITDKKIQHDDNNDGIVDYYTADVVKATDYSSFGAPLPGRTFEMAAYKYGYNGKEEDNETGYQNYGMRMYDPNIGRFLSVDPLTRQYPWYTPYQFAGNKPIEAIDLDGAEEYYINQQSQVKQRAILEESIKADQNARVADPLGLKKINQKNTQNANSASVGPDKSTWYSRQQSNNIKAENARNKAIQGATMDAVAGAVSASTLVTAQEYVTGVADHAVGIYDGVKQGDMWGTAKNTLLLGLDVAPLLIKGSGAISNEVNASHNLAGFERFKAVLSQQEILNSPAVNSALKSDPFHIAGSFVVEDVATKGRFFTIKGADGIFRNLTQMEGAVNNQKGIFEWIINENNQLSHQRFIPGGQITGYPNQVVK